MYTNYCIHICPAHCDGRLCFDDNLVDLVDLVYSCFCQQVYVVVYKKILLLQEKKSLTAPLILPQGPPRLLDVWYYVINRIVKFGSYIYFYPWWWFSTSKRKLK